MVVRRTLIKDLAQQLSLSTSTVSRALAGAPGISPATQQRVRDLAEALNFQVNRLAAGLRKGRTGVIGVIVPSLTGYFFPEVLHGITAAASRAGLRVIICESNEDEQQEQQQLLLLLAAQVDGLLVSAASATGPTHHFDAARQQGVPVVFFNQSINSHGINSVVLNNCQGAYEGVSHLLAQRRTRIALFTGARHLPAFRDHRRGYAEALQDQSLALDERLVRTGALTLAAGRQHMRALLAGPVAPNAIFASHELLAIGAMQVLKEDGRRIPQDVALAAFTTESLGALTVPALTSLDQRGGEMGQAAVQLLQRLLANTSQVAGSQCIILNPTLRVRASSAALPAAKKATRPAPAAKVAALTP